MLIRFHVSNFLSFNEEIELSMVPGKTQKHLEHIIRFGEGKNDLKLLKASLIYGANASGKSNLVKALKFAKDLIVNGTKVQDSILQIPFKLDSSCLSKPTKFEFEFLYGEKAYIYGYEFDDHRIYEEWLYEIKKTTEKKIFERHTNEQDQTKVDFGALKYKSKKQHDFFEFVAMGTRPNQLFLTESIERDIKQFRDVYDWFNNVLTIIFPESKYLQLGIGNSGGEDITSFTVNLLDEFGTGICGFDLSEIDLEKEFPEKLLTQVTKKAKENTKIAIIGPDNTRYFLEVTEEKQVKGYKLMMKHQMSTCQEEVLFNMTEESDGTIRLIDLIPILRHPDQKEHVFIIDELDRSIHPALSYELIKLFLQNAKSRSQIIVTTHEANLLTFDLLRRDEIWFIEKDKKGSSSLYSLEEYTPRYDRDIRKGYLRGRFGAIPILGHVNFE